MRARHRSQQLRIPQSDVSLLCFWWNSRKHCFTQLHVREASEAIAQFYAVQLMIETCIHYFAVFHQTQMHLHEFSLTFSMNVKPRGRRHQINDAMIVFTFHRQQNRSLIRLETRMELILSVQKICFSLTLVTLFFTFMKKHKTTFPASMSFSSKVSKKQTSVFAKLWNCLLSSVTILFSKKNICMHELMIKWNI